jgi:hypothetical protein
MFSVMLLQGAIANASQEVNIDEFLAFLADELPQATFFKFQPPPGKVYASAIDWRAVIMDAAAIITIANGLWQAYDRFVKPIHERDPSSNAAIFVEISNYSGEHARFMIGGDVKDKDIFISSFETSANRLNLDPALEATSQEIQDIRLSGNWIHIK